MFAMLSHTVACLGHTCLLLKTKLSSIAGKEGGVSQCVHLYEWAAAEHGTVPHPRSISVMRDCLDLGISSCHKRVITFLSPSTPHHPFFSLHVNRTNSDRVYKVPPHLTTTQQFHISHTSKHQICWKMNLQNWLIMPSSVFSFVCGQPHPTMVGGVILTCKTRGKRGCFAFCLVVTNIVLFTLVVVHICFHFSNPVVSKNCPHIPLAQGHLL